MNSYAVLASGFQEFTEGENCKKYLQMHTSDKSGNTQVYFLIWKGLKYKNRSVENVTVRRGDIYYADLSPVIGSEQGGVRPVLIIQNDVGNKHSPTVICAAITSRMNKAKLPTHIEISARKYRLVKNSVVLLEQIRTLDKKRLKEYVCHVDGHFMEEVNEAIRVSLELPTY